MKKRIFALFMCTVIMLSVMPAVAITDDEADNEVIYSGEYGENISWQLTEDGKLIISGEGPMEEYYDFNNNPWREFEYYEIDSIVINEGITKIGAGVFTDVQWYSNVYIPASVTEIETSNFWYTRLYGGFWVDEDNPNYSNDEDGNLYNKEQTKLIQASDSFYHIFIVPENVTEIERSAFFGCEFLDKFIVEEGNEHFSTDAKGVLYDKDKTRVVCIPDGMTGVVTIPDSVTEFEWAMVRNSTELEAIVFEGDAPEFIGNCKDPAVLYYPKDNDTWKEIVSEEDMYITWNSYDLAEPVFGPFGEFGDNMKWRVTEDGVLIISGEGDLPTNVGAWSDYYGAIRSVVFEEGITSIGFDYGFSFCENLTAISIPASVTTIKAEKYAGFSPFLFCYSLEKFIVDEENPKFSSDERGILYNKDKSILYKVPINCDIPSTFYIPDSVVSIADGAIVHYDVNEVIIPENLETIGFFAFEGSYSLQKFIVDENNAFFCSDENGVIFSKDMKKLEYVPEGITERIIIPASVEEIALHAFSENCCGAVIIFEGDAPDYERELYGKTIYYPKDNPTWTEEAREKLGDNNWIGYDSNNVITSGECGKKLTWQLDIYGVLTISGQGEMYDYNWESAYNNPTPWQQYYNIESVTIREGVTSIGNDAFSSKSIMNVSIPNTVTRIGDRAFSYCWDLDYIKIPASVLEIGEDAFWGSMRYISVDKENPNYSSDDYGVLYNKEMTEIIHIPSGIWGEYIIPDTITHLDYATFYLTSSELDCVTIPSSIISIDDSAFVKASIGRIVVDEDNPNFSSDEQGALLNKDMTELIYVPSGVEGKITISENVEIIRDGAFDDVLNRNIDAVPVIRFKGNAPIVEDDEPFWGWETTAYYPAGNPTWTKEAMASFGENITWLPYNPSERTQGDVDGNGELSNTDLVMVARYIVELYDENTVADIEAYGDMNGDGEVTNTDLITMARIIVGLV